MDRWHGKVAVVTGSSSGIGAAISCYLVERGMEVVGLARRESKLQELAEKLANKEGKFYPLKTDLTVEQDIIDAFSWVETNLGAVHVLVNNAGVIPSVTTVAGMVNEQIQTINNTFTMRQKMLDVNVLALTICSREALRSMKAHNIDDGNIINISSITAHFNTAVPGYAVYSGTKRAVQAITEGMRLELVLTNSNIKVTTICPGSINTEIFEAASLTVPDDLLCLQPEDVAEAVVFCLQMPRTAQVTDLHIRPTGENLMKYSLL